VVSLVKKIYILTLIFFLISALSERRDGLLFITVVGSESQSRSQTQRRRVVEDDDVSEYGQSARPATRRYP